MKVDHVKEILHTHTEKHTVLHDVTLSLPHREKMIAICGPSGCGKDNASQYYRLAGASERGEVCSMMKWRFAQTAAER